MLGSILIIKMHHEKGEGKNTMISKENTSGNPWSSCTIHSIMIIKLWNNSHIVCFIILFTNQLSNVSSLKNHIGSISLLGHIFYTACSAIPLIL